MRTIKDKEAKGFAPRHEKKAVFRSFSEPINITNRPIGNPIRVDTVTEKASRGKFAKLCVEVDLAQPLTPSVQIGKCKQPDTKRIYEGLHVISFSCGKVGHKKEDCRVKEAKPNSVQIDPGLSYMKKTQTEAPSSRIPARKWSRLLQNASRKFSQMMIRPFFFVIKGIDFI